MTTSAVKPGERIKDVKFTDDAMIVDLADGRAINVPLARYPRLLNAKHEERENWQLAGASLGIYWPDLDEDLSSEGLLRGAQAV
jgi:hypothetical protein